MDIFYRDQVNAGTLVTVSIPRIRGQANLLFFNDAGGGKTFVPGAIITQLNWRLQTNTQFQQSLENIIYVYSFGDRMGDLSISGLVFPRVCDSGANGIENLIKFYKERRVSEKVDLVQITFSNEVIKGYLIGMNLTTQDPSSGIHTWSLLLKTIPASFKSKVGSPGSTISGSNPPGLFAFSG